MRAGGRWGGRSRGVQREKRPSRHEPKRRVAVAARGRTVDRVVSRAPAPALRLVEEGRGLIGVERGARVPVDRNLGLDPSLPVVRRIRWGCCCCCGGGGGGGGGADAGVAADWGMWGDGRSGQEERSNARRPESRAPDRGGRVGLGGGLATSRAHAPVASTAAHANSTASRRILLHATASAAERAGGAQLIQHQAP